jgi:hypothetical protein
VSSFALMLRSRAPDLGFTRDRALQEDASRVNPTCVRGVSKHEGRRTLAHLRAMNPG